MIGNTFEPDWHQRLSLKTWYPKDHPLYLDPLHPALGLAGEAGEILDQWKKHLYKPGYKVNREKFLDELGDLWYYLRILYFQAKREVRVRVYVSTLFPAWQVERVLAKLNLLSARILNEVTLGNIIDGQILDGVTYWLLLRLDQLDCTLDELTALNYEKLRHGDNHGWKKAGERNEKRN